MHVTTLIHGIGSSSLFASRAFLPAFVTAVLLRLGPDIEWLASRGFLQNVKGAPTWFTDEITLWVLGILSAVEILLSKNAEAREFLNEVDRYLKSAMSVLTFIGMVNATDADFVNRAVQEAGFGDYPFLIFIDAAVGMNGVSLPVRGFNQYRRQAKRLVAMHTFRFYVVNFLGWHLVQNM